MVNLLNIWWTCSIYGELAQFMVNMLKIWWSRSICGEHPQFMVIKLNLWWTCSIYGEHAQYMMIMLNIWWTCWIYGEHAQYIMIMLNLWWTCSIYGENAQLDWPWKNDPLNVKIRPLDPKIQWYLFLCQLICTVTADLTSWLDRPWKATSKWPFECQNLSTGSKDTVIFVFKSADLYSHSWSDLTIG